ncbi:hypothetical protein GF324_14530 [bacterium]|nr:hypothetical protein [bacterium]
MVREGMVITVLTTALKFVGFAREWLLAYFFGAGVLVDAYRITNSIVIMVKTFLFGHHNENAMVPLVNGWRSRNNPRCAAGLLRSLAALFLFVSLLAFAVMLFAAPWIVHVQAPDFTGEQERLTILLLRWITPALPLYAAATFLGYLLATVHRFRLFAMIPAFINLGSLASIVAVGVFDAPVFLLAVGYWTGIGLGTILLALEAARFKPDRIRLTFQRAGRFLAPFLVNIWPLLLLSLLFQVRLFVDNRIASSLSIGAVAVLGYARFVIQTPFSTAGLAIVRLVLPRFSEMTASGRDLEIGRQYEKIIDAALWLILPFVAVTIVGAEQLIELIFGYGRFDDEAVQMTAWAMVGAAPSLWSRIIFPIGSRIFNAQRRNISLMGIYFVSVGLGIAAAILLSRRIGVAGITMGTVVSEFLLVIGMVWFVPGVRRGRTYRSILLWWGLTVGLVFVLRAIPTMGPAIAQLILFTVIAGALWILVSFLLPSGRRSLALVREVFQRLVKGS